MSSPRTPTLDIRGVVDAAASDLRESILSGALPSGTAVTEVLIADEYRIARPSAKAAIEKVVAEGLLERTAHRSARVRTLDSEAVSDIYRTRRFIEGAALRELAKQRTVPQAAEAANNEIRESGTRSPTAVVLPDLRFHLALVDGLGGQRMSTMYHGLASEVRLCMTQVQGRHLIDTTRIADEHAQILAALGAGDGELAADVLRRHLEHAEQRLVTALEASNSASQL